MPNYYYRIGQAYVAAMLLWWLLTPARPQPKYYIPKPAPKPESVVRETPATPRVEVQVKAPIKEASEKSQDKTPHFNDALPKPSIAPLEADSLKLLSGVCPPIRKAPEGQYPPILKELVSRVKNPSAFQDHSDPTDLVTWTHELTHAASNQVWNKRGKHGIYLLDGKGIVLPHPEITIEQVANSIPANRRGKIYKLYLVDQRRWWNDSPLYLCDEWCAYTHGAIAHKQMGWGSRRKDTFQSAKELEGYVREMLKVIEIRDPDYPDMVRLKQFVEYQSRRLP